MQIGPHTIAGKVFLAPMAGVSDRPFRNLCRRFGAAMACSEMLSSDVGLWHTRKSTLRLPSKDEQGLKAVQIAGTEPEQLARAARRCEQLGADIVDINMGCPAKKVCNKLAGSALLQNEALVAEILKAVVTAVGIPVTLKIRTGWDRDHRNAPTIASLAQDLGVAALAVHGRTRQCRFEGLAEYDTIAEIVQRVRVPVIANGDINSPQKAEQVLRYTGATGVMVGRGAFGRPWLFSEINKFLGDMTQVGEGESLASIMREHLMAMHTYYGEGSGVRIARKHINWYMQFLPARFPGLVNEVVVKDLRRQFNLLEFAEQQLVFIDAHQALLDTPVIQKSLPEEGAPRIRSQAA